jgi:protein-S-isoprenylcysteine O-methyltransferase Ste14
VFLNDRLAHDGHWLFRRRSFLPLVLAPLVLVAMLDFRYPGASHSLDRVWDIFCVAVTGLGVAIRAYTIGYAPPGTSANSTRTPVADALNTTGAYSLVRHPLYVGNFFMWLGIVLFPRQAFLVIVAALVFLIQYERIMIAEEKFLAVKFPAEFSAWAAATPAVVANFRNWRPSALPFAWRRVLRREYPGLFAAILIFTALEVMGDYVVTRRLAIEPGWAAFVGVGAVLYVGLLTVKRTTGWLDERNPEGAI